MVSAVQLLEDVNKEPRSIVVQRTLRSGQSVCFNGNVVVLGDVNPGAEITAAGDVIVMGVLRGVVHAGATGDPNAVVIAFRLQPTQLRIADYIARPPDEDCDNPERPEIGLVRDGALTIETFPPGGGR